MPPTKANNSDEQLKLERKKQRLKDERLKGEISAKRTQLEEMGNKPGQTKLFK